MRNCKKRIYEAEIPDFNIAIKKLLLILFALLNVGSVYSQPGSLILTHKESGRKVKISEGRTVKAIYPDGSKLKGKLTIINDSVAKIDSNVMMLDSIKTLCYKPRFTSGKIITTIGGAIVFLGGIMAYAILEGCYGWEQTIGVFLSLSVAAEGVCAVLVGVLTLTVYKNLELEKYFIAVEKE